MWPLVLKCHPTAQVILCFPLKWQIYLIVFEYITGIHSLRMSSLYKPNSSFSLAKPLKGQTICLVFSPSAPPSHIKFDILTSGSFSFT